MLGRRLGALLSAGDVMLLAGDLGAGKTQLAKGVAAALGVQQPITSPTFNIMFEYPTTVVVPELAPVPLRHFDLYRLETSEELDDIDYFGLLEDVAISIVEWGDKFPDALPEDYLLLHFELLDESRRQLQVSGYGRRSTALCAEFENAMNRVGV
jgi:tRNA threonylcarbamoyladenosine biosynthesis protein TsaE